MRKECVLVSVLVRLRGSNAHLPRVLVQNHPVAAVAKRAKSIYAAWLPKVMAANKAAAPNRPHLHPHPPPPPSTIANASARAGPTSGSWLLSNAAGHTRLPANPALSQTSARILKSPFTSDFI
jgi:hypothetical protein